MRRSFVAAVEGLVANVALAVGTDGLLRAADVFPSFDR